MPLLQGYGGGGREDTGVGVEYRLTSDLVTTRVVMAVLVRSFVEVSDFVVLWSVATGGWCRVEVVFQGWLDVRVVVVEAGGVVLTYTGLDVLLTGVGYHGDDRTSEYDTDTGVDEVPTKVEDQVDGDDRTSFTTVLTPEYDTGVAELPTVLEYQLDEDARTSFTPVFATGSEDKTPPSPTPSFRCIPSTKGSALPSLAGACFNQHLPRNSPSSTF